MFLDPATSLSIGNVVNKKHTDHDPVNIIKKYGSDLIRLYFLNSQGIKGIDMIFDENQLTVIAKKSILAMLNTYNFFEKMNATIKLEQ